MDKNLLVFIAIGVGFLYATIHFVGKLQEDDRYASKQTKYKQEQQSHYARDSIGRVVLDLRGLSFEKQVKVWNQDTILKQDFIEIFPDFNELKRFVDERIMDESFKQKLKAHIEKVELDFLSGKIQTEDAVSRLKVMSH